MNKDNTEAHHALDKISHLTIDSFPNGDEYSEYQWHLNTIRKALTALETLIDREAVVSMLEGMEQPQMCYTENPSDFENGEIYGHNTALDEAIKNVEEM